jgi:hypothetical protein
MTTKKPVNDKKNRLGGSDFHLTFQVKKYSLFYQKTTVIRSDIFWRDFRKNIPLHPNLTFGGLSRFSDCHSWLGKEGKGQH